MRELLIHRPLVLLAAGLVLGVAAMTNVFACVLLLVVLLIVRELRGSLACGAGFAFGALIAPLPIQPLLARQWLDADARVTGVPRLFPTGMVAEIGIGHDRYLMSAPRDSGVVLGEVVHVRGLAKPLKEGAERLATRGIKGRISPVSITEIQPAPFIFSLGQAWRDSFVEFCDRWLPPQAAAATAAVCFNVDSALDPASRDALSRSGTVHVVSASGLHVGLLAAALLAILGRLPIPRWSQLSVLAFVLVLFAVASGLNPPVIRTCVMALILSTAYLLKREPDMLSALGIAAVVQMLWDPRAIFDPGFQLSFTLIGAFALFASRAGTVRESFRAQLVNKGREGLRQGVVATAGAAPLVAYTFGLVSFTSVVSNLLLALALPVMVVGAMLAHLVSFVVPALGVGLMVGLVGPLAGWLYFVAEHMGGEWAALSVPAFSGYWVLLAYAVMIAAWRPRLRPA